MVNDRKRVIQKKIEQIKRSKREIVEEQKQKWLGWWQENKDKLQLSGSLPKQAFIMLLECLGINPKEIRVISDDDKKIIWWAFNFCPILEACKILGMDTREVCRRGYEEPVQDLISHLHPNLRFSRNYQKIRPYAPYCEETIELIVDFEDKSIVQNVAKKSRKKRRSILKKYLIVKWWRWPLPDQEMGDCLPEVEEFNSEDEAKRRAREKKKQANPKKGIPENRVLIAEVIEEF